MWEARLVDTPPSVHAQAARGLLHHNQAGLVDNLLHMETVLL